MIIRINWVHAEPIVDAVWVVAAPACPIASKFDHSEPLLASLSFCFAYPDQSGI